MPQQDTYNAPSIIASGTTWSQYKAGGLDGILERLISANGAKADPAAAATATATGGGATGGSLAAGAYRMAYTNCDAFGETTIGASEVAAAITVAAGNIPRITMPALPTGVVYRNVYITKPGGASGTETLYATGVTGTTFDLSFAAPGDVLYPTAPRENTTGADEARNQGDIRALFRGRGATFATRIKQTHDVFVGPSPVERRDQFALVYRWAGILALLNTAVSEASALVWANIGTWGLTAGPNVKTDVRQTHSIA